ncbi:MAG: phospholipid-binding protein [Verrucomicrobiaceae bacterium]|nr:phospholipid-binding protein [Verrucomicrobiaceae bacterium]
MGFALSPLQLRSKSITNGIIPAQHSKEGGNISPPLSWSHAPDKTKSYALICHDPDAPLIKDGEYGFVHWVLYNIPAITELAKSTDIGTSGINSYGETGYGGPKPPPGHGVHHYFFMLFALGAALDLPAGLTMRQLLEKIEPQVLGMNRLVGTFEIKEQ